MLGSAGPGTSNDVSTMTDRLGTAATGYPYGTDTGNPPGNDQPDFATYTRDGATGFEYANQRYYFGAATDHPMEPAGGSGIGRSSMRISTWTCLYWPAFYECPSIHSFRAPTLPGSPLMVSRNCSRKTSPAYYPRPCSGEARYDQGFRIGDLMRDIAGESVGAVVPDFFLFRVQL